MMNTKPIFIRPILQYLRGNKCRFPSITTGVSKKKTLSFWSTSKREEKRVLSKIKLITPLNGSPFEN